MDAKNTIGYAEELHEAARTAGGDYNAARAAVQAAALHGHPVTLGTVEAVNYDAKTDRYIIRFGGLSAARSSTAKATNAVAEFLLTHAFAGGARPSVNAHFTDGSIDAVYLLFLSRT